MAGITDWLTAIGTVGAFGVALYLLSIQIRDRHDERVRGQARLVAAWIDELHEEPQNDAQQPTLWKANVVIQNDSSEPVYHVVVRLPAGVRGTFVRGVGIIGPHEGREFSFLIPGFLKSELAPDVLFFDKAGVTWIRKGQTGKLARVKIDDIIAFQKEDARAYSSIEAHPTLGIVDNIHKKGK